MFWLYSYARESVAVFLVCLCGVEVFSLVLFFPFDDVEDVLGRHGSRSSA